ncbi:prephenate dehydratase [Halovenus rubra]|uniref:Prephenate dehydratase n=2 Tax=Halovenus rubra TaxID=869890 RepID=A0ABD5X3F1_9EURY|nr:prephenate dehydratase [Halovenus rubra]
METLTLGPAGTYSHRAARAVSDEDAIQFTESVTGIVETVAQEKTARGVVPVENSIEGPVTETLDAFTEHEIAVIREVVTPIRHALLAQNEEFEIIASHAQALAQCRSVLEENYPEAELEAVTSTARGVERAHEDPSVAAIGHPDNAKEPLQTLAEDIQDRSSNATRFLVVAPRADLAKAGSKTSLIVYPNRDYPGLLLELLNPLAEQDINLTRVESRPSGERLGDYVFHVDIAAGLYEDRTVEALREIEELADAGWVRRLGSYDTETIV